MVEIDGSFERVVICCKTLLLTYDNNRRLGVKSSASQHHLLPADVFKCSLRQHHFLSLVLPQLILCVCAKTTQSGDVMFSFTSAAWYTH